MSILAVDLDGTIVDCRPRQVRVIADVLAGLNLPCPCFEEWWTAKREGLDTAMALERCTDEKNRNSFISSRKVIRTTWLRMIEEDHYLDIDPLLAGAATALQRLASSSGPPLLITARRNQSGVESTLDRLSIRRAFSDVIVVDPFDRNAKATALQRSGARYYIGDTERDYTAAVTAGVRPILVSSGQRNEAFLLARTSQRPHDDLLASVEALSAASRS